MDFFKKYFVYGLIRNVIRNRRRKIFYRHKHFFDGKRGIEIGGPSAIFSSSNSIPIYSVCQTLDNINYRSENFWSTISAGNNFIFNSEKVNGYQFITDGTDLSILPSNSYDFLICSHVIEHIANPIKALLEWKRIVRDGGVLLIIAPNKKKTYDRNRPTTSLSHLKDDYLNGTVESDNTHYNEVITLHDLTIDTTVESLEDHIFRTNDNINTRIVHHHTFELDSLLSLLLHCNFNILDYQVFFPYHLAVLVTF